MTVLSPGRAFLFLAVLALSFAQAKPKNVLFIVVDDLRPELKCYGADYIHSPNIDKLAEQGVLFERAYVQQPVCTASRASFLTGLRPMSPKIFWASQNCSNPNNIKIPANPKPQLHPTFSPR